MSHIKIIHVLGKYRKRKWDSILVPEIRMNGKWLSSFGFDIGDKVEIKKSINSITITKINK
tara:strand:- start:524 stop:706 length:183 start_codon:yes stop_codon:yes gene_type:complete